MKGMGGVGLLEYRPIFPGTGSPQKYSIPRERYPCMLSEELRMATGDGPRSSLANITDL